MRTDRKVSESMLVMREVGNPQKPADEVTVNDNPINPQKLAELEKSLYDAGWDLFDVQYLGLNTNTGNAITVEKFVKYEGDE